MSNRVKIATIAAKAPGNKPDSDDRAVEKMIEHWEARFAQVLPDRPDLIVVPECCDRYDGFTSADAKAYYKVRGNRVRDAFAKVARENGCYVTYSAVHEMEDGTWRNSVQLLDRKGEVAGRYSKNHLVIEENTEAGALCGKEATVIETDFGRVGFTICFDLNFEPVRLRYKALSPDLMVFSSVYHGGLMQAYWAYFLRCHLVTSVAAVPSGIINPVGEKIASTTNYFDFVTQEVNLDCEVCHLDYNWDKLTALKAKYGQAVTVRDPGFLGSVLLTSESPDRSAADLVAEAGLERLDDYFARALAFHAEPAHIEG